MKDIEEIPPLPRAGATHELDTMQPVTDVANAPIKIAADPARPKERG